MASNLKACDKFRIKRHLLSKGAILVEDTPIGDHPVFEVPNSLMRQYVQSLSDKGILLKVFVWRHGYYMLTELGQKILNEELVFGGSAQELKGEEEPVKAEQEPIQA